MRYLTFSCNCLLMLSLVWLFSGCEESSTEPEPVDTYSLSGTLVAPDGLTLTEVTINLYEAPQDDQIAQLLSAYPTVGFAQYRLMMHHPFKDTPIRSIHPNQQGDFTFGNLTGGRYIVNAYYPGHACPVPLLVELHSQVDAGELELKAKQPIAGNITLNTTWTTGSVYRIDSDIMVLPGVQLTIEENCMILLSDDYEIQVYGYIMIDGTPSLPVVFRRDEETTEEYAEWAGILIGSGAGYSEINGAAFHQMSKAVEIKGGPVDIRECLLAAPRNFGVYFESKTDGSVLHSILFDGYHGLTSRNSDHEFGNNIILRMSGHGVEAKDSSTVNIHNNVIVDCDYGIFTDWFTAPTIRQNLIQGGRRALDVTRGFDAVFEYNELREQTDEGIYFHIGYNYPITFNYNNFIDMPQHILYVSGNAAQQADTVFAQFNYWDGEDDEGIPARIIDGYDHGSLQNPIGPVIFDPYLETPELSAGP